MLELPTIAHVTLTVSDLDRSVQWYERLFDVKLFLDESPGPFRRARLAGRRSNDGRASPVSRSLRHPSI